TRSGAFSAGDPGRRRTGLAAARKGGAGREGFDAPAIESPLHEKGLRAHYELASEPGRAAPLRLSRNRAPPSTAFSTTTVPPCASATSRTIERPSPAPDIERAAAER